MSKSTKRSKQISTKASESPYPSPFDKASTSIESFLSQLDPSQVYITHVDRNKTDFKKQIFFLAVLVNGSIAALLAWRFYVAVPKYLALGQRSVGIESSASVDTENTTRQDQVWILLQRVGMMIFDYLLVRLVGPWPWSFFFERPANPVTWRWKVGFLPQEVVVRTCRNWKSEDLMQGAKRGDQSPFFKTKIQPAIEGEFMQKTGYLMMDGNWDLDMGLMSDAHYLVNAGKVRIQDLDMVVFAHQEGTGWLAWNFGTSSGTTEDNSKKMIAFKDTLTKMGKESLFWKWQEVVEKERDADGGFGAEAQQRVATRVSEEFKKEGLDFDEVVGSVGGVQKMPVVAR